MPADSRCPLHKLGPSRYVVGLARLSSMNARHLALTALAVWTLFTTATAQAAGPEEELLRQQERERALRDQLESRPDVRLQAPSLDEGGSRLPVKMRPASPLKTSA